MFSAGRPNAVPVAEFTVAQILLAGKGYFQGLRRQERAGRAAFDSYSNTFPCNYHVKVGILGAGWIGSRVLEMLKAYDLETLAYDPFASDEKLQALGAKRAHLGGDFLPVPDHLQPHRQPARHPGDAHLRLVLPG